MKKILLSSVALLGLTASAFAADLPSRRAPAVMAAVPAFTWTGFYVGVNAGYGWNTNNDDVFVPGVGFVGNGGSDGGFVGGGQIGYNYQMGSFVIGAEADIQWADLGRGRRNDFGFLGFDNGHDNEFFGTVRARAGVALDRALLYVTGGLAYGDSDAGWTLGAGVEYAFTDNLTAKIEGLYVSLDGHNRNDFGLVGFGGRDNNNEFGVVRVGLNYKFTSY